MRWLERWIDRRLGDEIARADRAERARDDLEDRLRETEHMLRAATRYVDEVSELIGLCGDERIARSYVRVAEAFLAVCEEHAPEEVAR